MSLPFQWHLIQYNWSLSSEDTTLWIWLGHYTAINHNQMCQNSTFWLFKCWPVNPPFKVGGMKRMIIALRRYNDRNYQFKCWLSLIDDAVGRLSLTRKQLKQIRYHFKAEHLSFLTIIKSKQSHIWFVTHPYSQCHIFTQKYPIVLNK